LQPIRRFHFTPWRLGTDPARGTGVSSILGAELAWPGP
jgi:hypothetical protein